MDANGYVVSPTVSSFQVVITSYSIHYTKLYDISSHFETENTLGLKYLINHSAGSGKTLTISWLTDRLDSLYSANNHKIFDMVIVLTDRKSLDKNIKDELANFVHLTNKIGLAKDSDKLKNFIRQRKSIVVSTIQKFSYIQEIIQEDEGLKQLRIRITSYNVCYTKLLRFRDRIQVAAGSVQGLFDSVIESLPAIDPISRT